MLGLHSYTRTSHLYKQRVDAGHIPLHSNHSVALHESAPAVKKKMVALKLLSFTIEGHFVKNGNTTVLYAAIVTGHYECGVTVPKFFLAGLDHKDELPTVILRDPRNIPFMSLPANNANPARRWPVGHTINGEWYFHREPVLP